MDSRLNVQYCGDCHHSGGYVVKKVVFMVFLPVLLGACADYSKDLPTEELRALKPACAGGDTSVCADIGHTVRRERAEAAYLAGTTE